MGHFEREKDDAELDRLQREYTYLIKSTERYFLDEDRETEEFEEAKNEFECEFVRMNCELQNNRSEIHHMKDNLLFQDKLILVGYRLTKDMDHDIKEKKSLNRLLEERIEEIRLSYQ